MSHGYYSSTRRYGVKVKVVFTLTYNKHAVNMSLTRIHHNLNDYVQVTFTLRYVCMLSRPMIYARIAY